MEEQNVILATPATPEQKAWLSFFQKSKEEEVNILNSKLTHISYLSMFLFGVVLISAPEEKGLGDGLFIFFSTFSITYSLSSLMPIPMGVVVDSSESIKEVTQRMSNMKRMSVYASFVLFVGQLLSSIYFLA